MLYAVEEFVSSIEMYPNEIYYHLNIVNAMWNTEPFLVSTREILAIFE